MFSNGIDFSDILLGKENVQRAEVLAEVLLLLSSGDGDKFVSLGQDPSKTELTGGASLPGRDFSTNKVNITQQTHAQTYLIASTSLRFYRIVLDLIIVGDT